jgi:hypothetical protein
MRTVVCTTETTATTLVMGNGGNLAPTWTISMCSFICPRGDGGGGGGGGGGGDGDPLHPFRAIDDSRVSNRLLVVYVTHADGTDAI